MGGRGRGGGAGAVPLGAQDLVALLAWWVQTGKCTLSREKGREIGGSFLKTTRLKSPRVPPRSPRGGTDSNPVPGARGAARVPLGRRRAAVTPGRPGAAPRGSTSLSTCQFWRGASPSEPRAEVARGYPKSDDAARPEQPGIATAGGAPGTERKAGRRRRVPAVAKAPGLPSAAMAPRGLRGRAWRPVSPRHCLFRPAQAFNSRPHSATFPPRVRGGIAGK